MAGAIGLGHFGIVLGPLIDILDHQADRRPGSLAFEHAGEDPHRVRFLPLGGELRLARPARVQKRLDRSFADRQPRGAAIDHGAQRRPVAFAPGGETQQTAKGVERHDVAALAAMW